MSEADRPNPPDRTQVHFPDLLSMVSDRGLVATIERGRLTDSQLGLLQLLAEFSSIPEGDQAREILARRLGGKPSPYRIRPGGPV